MAAASGHAAADAAPQLGRLRDVAPAHTSSPRSVPIRFDIVVFKFGQARFGCYLFPDLHSAITSLYFF